MAEVQVNGHTDNINDHEAAHQATPALTIDIPLAKQAEIEITDYIRKSLDKVAMAEGFKNYELHFDHGSSIGDGFVGVILKISIKENSSDKELNVLAKIPPANKARRDQMKSMNLFEREVYAYNVVIPEFVKMQEEKKISKSMGFYNFPKVYYAEYDKEIDDAIIVMEDLRESGHKMWSKFKPIDLEHSKLLMKALGRFHALSFAYKAKKPDQFEKFKDLQDYFSTVDDENFKMYFEQSFVQGIDSLKPEDKKTQERAGRLVNLVFKHIEECGNSELAEPFAVLNHGDCWVNNYVYHYTKRGSPDDIVLIDWQIMRYCSPVLDLSYFLFASTDQALRIKHFDELLNIYHRSLKELLDHLGGDTMTQFPFTALLRQLRKFGKFGVFTSMMMIPMMQIPNDELVDMDYMAEQMKDPDPKKMEEIQKFFESKVKEGASKRRREVLCDAVSYGYI
jgi:thiamine kinase-like enzyme